MDDPFDDENGDYDVGYKKPPKKYQFKEGNKAAAGKRKKKKITSIADHLHRILGEKVSIKANGQLEEMTNIEVITKAIIRSAQKGNLRAVKLIEELGGPEIIQPEDKGHPDCIKVTFVRPKPIRTDDDPEGK